MTLLSNAAQGQGGKGAQVQGGRGGQGAQGQGGQGWSECNMSSYKE